MDQAEIQGLLDQLAGFIDFDYVKEVQKTKRTINFNTWDTQKAIVKAWEYLGFKEPSKALLKLYEVLPDQISWLQNFKPEDFSDPKRLKDITDLNTYIARVSALVKEWKESDFVAELDQYEKNGLIQKKDRKEITEFTSLYVDELVSKEGFQCYVFQKGKTPLPRDLPWALSKNILITPDLNSLLSMIDRLQSPFQGFSVSLVLKLDEPLDFSYFILVFVYKDHIWLSTNRYDFENPYSKCSRRNPSRDRENKYRNTALPDRLIEEIDKLRSKSKEISFPGVKFEVLRYPIVDLHPEERIYLAKLIDAMVRLVHATEIEITTFGRFVEQKLLASEQVASNETGLDGWNKGVQERVKELLDTVPTSKSLIVREYSLVKSSESFDEHWLATPEQLARLATWHTIDKQRESIQKQLDKLEDSWYVAFTAYDKMLNFAHVAKYAFLAESVYCKFVTVEQFSFEEAEPGVAYRDKFIESGSEYGTNFVVGIPGTAKYKERFPCANCGKHPAKPQRIVRIRRYEQLMLLADVDDRMKLPPYLRSYRAHEQEPYYGNSILENTHPLARLRDHATFDNPNGLTLVVYCCGWCTKRLLAEKKEITIDFQGKEVEEKLPERRYGSVLFRI